MEVIYKAYEPEKGYETFQAEIYNNAIEKYNGNFITPEDIHDRLKYSHPPQDLHGIFFAFTVDNRPLSYIQYHIQKTKKLYIDHAWSTHECPKEVQQKLYDIMIQYIKAKYPDKKEIYLGYIDESFIDVVQFIKSQGFKPYDTDTYYSLDLDKLSSLEPDQKFNYREATIKDLDLLVSLALKSNLKTSGEAWLRTYLKAKVLREGNCMILFDEQDIIGSTAIIDGYYDGKESLISFQAIKDCYKNIQKSLLIYLGRYLLNKGLKLPLMVMINNNEDIDYQFIKKIGTVKEKETVFIKTFN